MNPNLAPDSTSEIISDSLSAQLSGNESSKPRDSESGFKNCSGSGYGTPLRKFHPRLAACIAFFSTVFVSMAAAATVVSNDIPLMLGGL